MHFTDFSCFGFFVCCRISYLNKTRNSHLQLLEKYQLVKSQLELEHMLKVSIQKDVNLSFIVCVVQLESLKLDNTFLLRIPTVWKVSPNRDWLLTRKAQCWGKASTCLICFLYKNPVSESTQPTVVVSTRKRCSYLKDYFLIHIVINNSH